MDKSHLKISRLFLIASAILLIVTYPLAIIPSGFISLAYHISIPSFFILSLFSLPVIISGRFRPNRALTFLIVLYLIPLIYNLCRFNGITIDSVCMLGYFSIPLAAAIIFRSAWSGSENLERDDEGKFRVLCNFGFYFWLYLVVHGYWSLTLGEEIVSLTGNRNWTGSLLLAASPWAYNYLIAFFGRATSLNQRSSQRRIITAASFVLTAVPTFVLVYHCESRGAWLALAAWAVMILFYRVIDCLSVLLSRIKSLGRSEKVAVSVFAAVFAATTVTIAVFGVVYLSSPRNIEKLSYAIKSDVRVPLWSSTMKLIRDNDSLVSLATSRMGSSENRSSKSDAIRLGVGAGRFTTEFSAYRSRSTYHDRLVAAPLTIHPHNEFLYVASQLGIVAAVAWLLALLPLIRRPKADSPLLAAARLSAFLIYFHGFFDLVLIRSPGNILAFICLGICWRDALCENKRPPKMNSGTHIQKAAVSLSLLILLCAATYVSFRKIATERYIRRGLLNEAFKKYSAAFDSYMKALRIDPDNISCHLFAGAVALDRLNSPASAMPILLRAHELDPNFGHLNEKIGHGFSMLGMHERALPFFIRECKLYPRFPRAFQNYFLSLYLNRDYERLVVVNDFLVQLYCDKVRLKFQEGELIKKIGEWLTSVEQNNVNRALVLAEEFTSEIDKSGVDPLFHSFTGDRRWPANWLRGRFEYVDFVYWRQMVLLKRQTFDFAKGEESRDNINVSISKVVSLLKDRVAIDHGNLDQKYPARVWYDQEGSLHSTYWLLASIFYQHGFSVWIEIDTDGVPVSCSMEKDKYVYTVNLTDHAVLTSSVANAEYRINRDLSHKLFLNPQEFWLRNQILGVLINRYGPPASPRFDELPLLRVISLMRRQGKTPINSKDQFREYFFTEHIEGLAEQLKSHPQVP